MYFRSYTCITELIHVFQILYLSYRTYTCLKDLIFVLQDLFLSYRSYTCVTELILVYRILFFCEGTRRYDKSEHITYKVRSDLCRYGHKSVVGTDHIKYMYQVYTDSERIPKQTELSVYIRIIFRLIHFLMLITGLCLFGSPIGVTELILGFLILYGAYSRISDREIPVGIIEHFSCTKVPVGTTEQIHYTEVPVGTTGLILILSIREYP